jgi:chorismate-pyruvate lyase
VSVCDHRVPAGFQLHSTHTTSLGTVAYSRCRCGAWLVLLDGQRLATSGHPASALPAKRGLGDRPSGRGRRVVRLRSHAHALVKTGKGDADDQGSRPDRGQAANTSDSVDVDPFDRMLLTADGTVTSLLEACTGEPITTTTTRQAGPATLDVLLAATGRWWQPDSGLVEPAPTEQLIVRRVTLHGERSGTPYVLAESLVVPDRLPGVNIERLRLAGGSLGRLLAASGLETHRELLRITTQRAGPASDHLATEPNTTLACRTYSIVVRQRAAAVVTEWLVPGRLATAALRGDHGAGREPPRRKGGTDLPGQGWGGGTS